MKKIRFLAICIFLSLNAVMSYAQQTVIPLETPLELGKCKAYSYFIFGKPTYWSKDGMSPDSVEYDLSSRGISEKYRVRPNGDMMQVFRVMPDGIHTEKTSIFSFTKSIKINKEKKFESSSLIKNSSNQGLKDYFLLHKYDGSVFLSDSLKIFEPMIVSVTNVCIREANFEGEALTTWTNPKASDYTFKMQNCLKVSGHESNFVNNVKRQSDYAFGDTVFLGGKYYRFDSVDVDNTSAYFTPIIAANTYKVPEALLKLFVPYFGERQYLLIDFFGTWCKPCIAGLPELRNIYELHKRWFSFVSVCEDMPKNTELAKSIFKENKVSWSLLSNVYQNDKKITTDMKIATFPNFVIIDRTGKILYQQVGSHDEELVKAIREIEN